MNISQKRAYIITSDTKNRIPLFLDIPNMERREVFRLLSTRVKRSIVTVLDDRNLVDLIDSMDSLEAQETAIMISSVERRNAIIHQLNTETKTKIDTFLSFNPKAGVSLFSFNYITIDIQSIIQDVSAAVDRYYLDNHRFPEVLITEHGKLVGEVWMSDLIKDSKDTKIASILKSVISAVYTTEKSVIAQKLHKSKHSKVVVMDTDDSIIGIIYADDVARLYEASPAEALYNFAGVSKDELPFDSVAKKFNSRYIWLLINLSTGFLAASVVSLFQGSIDSLVVLAMYMPIIAGMGGNAATQTLAVVVRGITTGEVTLENGWPAVRREVITGLLNGLLNGAIIAVVALLWNQNALLGLVLAVSMVVNLVVAAFFGATIPLVLKKLGKDPATSATIFITTATDVLGFFTFLGLATLVLL